MVHRFLPLKLTKNPHVLTFFLKLSLLNSLSFSGKSTSGKSKKQLKTPKTPSAGDRFIPNRASTQFELGYYKVMSENIATTDQAMMSPSQQEYQKIMNENLNGEILNSKIISYKSKPPNAPEGKYFFFLPQFVEPKTFQVYQCGLLLLNLK